MENHNNPQESSDSKSEYYEIPKQKRRRLIIILALASLFLFSLFIPAIRSFYNTLGRVVGESIYRQKFLFTEVNAESCEGYLKYFGDRRFSDCFDHCHQIFDCENAKKTKTIEALKAYLNKYPPNEEDSCRIQITAMLDSLECKAAVVAENKMDAYKAYLDTYGNKGVCSDRMTQELLNCEALLTEKDCLPYLNYINTEGTQGVCYDSAMIYLLENNCGLDSDLICRWLKRKGDCDLILKHFGRLDPKSDCYNDLKRSLKEQCNYSDDEIAYYEALASGDQSKALRNFLDTYDNSSFRGLAENALADLKPGPTTYGSTTNTLRPRSADCGNFNGIKAVRIGQLWFMQYNMSSPYADLVSSAHDQNFGGLYTWKEAHNACPEGWRLPCEQEIAYIQEIYSDPYTALSNNGQCRFSATFGGYFSGNSNFLTGVGNEGAFWCATEQSDKTGYAYVFNKNFNSFTLTWMNKNSRLSCRCVKEYDPRTTASPFLKLANCPDWPIQ